VCVCVCNTISNVRCQIPSVIDRPIDTEHRVPQFDVQSFEDSTVRYTQVEDTTPNYRTQQSCW